MIISCRWFGFIFRGATLLSCVALSSTLFAAANNQYCGTKQSHAILSAEKLKSAALDDGTEVEFSRRDLASGLIVSREQGHKVTVEFNFQYTIISFDDSITPMTNGHLHTWDFPFQGRLSNIDSELFYDITPAISVSSNVLKNPELIGSDGLQLYTSLVYKKNTSVNTAWFLGFRSDHRFGSYKAYPVVGVCIQAANDWILQLALPDFSIQRRFNRRFIL